MGAGYVWTLRVGLFTFPSLSKGYKKTKTKSQKSLSKGWNFQPPKSQNLSKGTKTKEILKYFLRVGGNVSKILSLRVAFSTNFVSLRVTFLPKFSLSKGRFSKTSRHSPNLVTPRAKKVHKSNFFLRPSS